MWQLTEIVSEGLCSLAPCLMAEASCGTQYVGSNPLEIIIGKFGELG